MADVLLKDRVEKDIRCHHFSYEKVDDVEQRINQNKLQEIVEIANQRNKITTTHYGNVTKKIVKKSIVDISDERISWMITAGVSVYKLKEPNHNIGIYGAVTVYNTLSSKNDIEKSNDMESFCKAVYDLPTPMNKLNKPVIWNALIERSKQQPHQMLWFYGPFYAHSLDLDKDNSITNYGIRYVKKVV